MGIPYSVIKFFGIGLLILRELLIEKYNSRSVFLGLIFVALMFTTGFESSTGTIIYILIYIFCARNIEFKQLAKFSAVVSIATLLFVIGSSYVGIIDNYIAPYSARNRHYLGFRYALFGPVILFNATGLVLYVKKSNIRWIELAALMVLNIWVYDQTDSRLSFYLSMMLIIAFVILKLRPDFLKRRRVICYGMVFSFALFFVLLVFCTYMYNENVSWMSFLNRILNNRLKLGWQAFKEYGITFFGQKIELVGWGLDAYGNRLSGVYNSYNYIDIFYIQILIRYGVVFAFFWIGFLTYCMYYFLKVGDYELLLCLSFIAVHCTVDDLCLHLYYNTFWLSTAAVLTKLYQSRQYLRQSGLNVNIHKTASKI